MMDGERTYCTSTGEIYIMNDKILKVRRYPIRWRMVLRLDLTFNLQLYRLTFEEPKHVPAGTRTGITRL